MPSMPSRSPAPTLQDILENIRLARSFIAGLSFTDFQADRRTSYAVVRCLEIISEASRRLPTELKVRHPTISWKQTAGAGNVYRHNYEDVAAQFIWDTVQHALPALTAVLEQEIAREPQ